MELDIFKAIAELVNAWYEVRLWKQYIEIYESYKSESREVYEDKKIFYSFWSVQYFDKSSYLITRKKLESWVKELTKEAAKQD